MVEMRDEIGNDTNFTVGPKLIHQFVNNRRVDEMSFFCVRTDTLHAFATN